MSSPQHDQTIDQDADTLNDTVPSETLRRFIGDPAAPTLCGRELGDTTVRQAETVNEADDEDSASHRPTIGTGRHTQSGSGSQHRTMRTRIATHLPAAVRPLDQSLQLSRRSIYRDLLTFHTSAQLPATITRRFAASDTDGRYAINHEIAQGGMGAVLDVRDIDFQRQTAMKVIHSRYARQAQALERFLEEAQITAQLEHPNIVPIHDVGVMPDGTLYYTMKRIAGESFSDILRRLIDADPATCARWSEEAVLLAFLKALDGLGYAHDHQVLHRDIKPANIMVEDHGEVLLVDWGLAKVLGRDEGTRVPSASDPFSTESSIQALRDDEAAAPTRTGALLGTPSYMSPEQARGGNKDLDQRADIYAIGLCLYELLGHCKVFTSKIGVKQLIKQICAGAIPSLLERAPQLHIDLVAIVHKAIATDRTQRYAHCAAFADDIRAYLAGKAVAARRRNVIERLGAWFGQHRMPVISGLSALALLIAGIVLTRSLETQRRHREAAQALEQVAQALAEDDKFGPAQAPAPRLASLRPLRNHLAVAHQLAPDDPLGRDLERELGARIGRLESRVEAAAHQAGERARASSLLDQAYTAEAQAAQDPTALDRAAELLAAALRLDCNEAQHAEILGLRDRVQGAIAEARLSDQRRQAARLIERLDELATQARSRLASLPLLDEPGIIERRGDISDIERSIDLLRGNLDQRATLIEQARQLDPRRSDIDRALGLLNRQRQMTDHLLVVARGQADRYRRSRNHLDAAETALLKGALKEASERISLALELTPSDRQVRASYDRIAAAQRSAAIAAQRATLVAEAETALQSATAHWTAQRGLDLEREQLAREIAALHQGLAQAPIDDKEVLFAAHDRQRQLRAESARHIQQSLADAERCLELLGPEAHPLRGKAQELLSTIAAAQLARAETAGDASAMLRWRQELHRHDQAGRFEALDAPAQLLISGPPATLTPLALHAARFQRFGPPQQLTPDTVHRLPAGRYLLERNDQRQALRLRAGTLHTCALPTQDTRLTGEGLDIALDWVPATDQEPGFWLAREEVSHALWLRFCRQPAQWAQIRAALAAQLRGEHATIPLVPARGGNPYLSAHKDWPWIDFDLDRQQLRGLQLPEAIADQPVAGITRADAEQFCAWASERSGRQVRLPLLAEWRRAASGGDPERLWPWGPIFDHAFTVSHATSPSGPLPAGSRPVDRGPYGHLDLAGNLREWLGDRTGPLLLGYDALAAGGAFADTVPDRFRSQAVEALSATAISPILGLRMLVEDLETPHQ